MNFSQLITSFNVTNNVTSSLELTTSQLLLTTSVDSNAPLFIMKKISGDIPEFEIILPCIFGIFIVLSLGLMVFYTKSPSRYATKVTDNTCEREHEGERKTDSSWF